MQYTSEASQCSFSGSESAAGRTDKTGKKTAVSIAINKSDITGFLTQTNFIKSEQTPFGVLYEILFGTLRVLGELYFQPVNSVKLFFGAQNVSQHYVKLPAVKIAVETDDICLGVFCLFTCRRAGRDARDDGICPVVDEAVPAVGARRRRYASGTHVCSREPNPLSQVLAVYDLTAKNERMTEERDGATNAAPQKQLSDKRR